MTQASQSRTVHRNFLVCSVLGSNFLLNLGDIIRVFRKVRKTQHQNLEFRPKPGEIRRKKKKKNLQKQYISLQGGRGVKLRNEPFFWVGN